MVLFILMFVTRNGKIMTHTCFSLFNYNYLQVRLSDSIVQSLYTLDLLLLDILSTFKSVNLYRATSSKFNG